MFKTLFNSISAETQITMIIIWIVLLITAIVFEIATTDLVSIWFGVGALGGLVGAVFKIDIYLQFLIFAIVSILLVIATRPFVKKLTSNTEIKTNAGRLIGQIAEVTKDILPFSRGEVLVEFQTWGAIGLNNQQFLVGNKVVIHKIEGNKLIVDAIQEIEIN